LNSLRQLLGEFGNVLQNQLFPPLREEFGPMGVLHEKFVATLAMLGMDGFVSVRHGRGRPAHPRSVARQFGLRASTVRAIDQRYLERWAKGRRKPVLREQSGNGRAAVVRRRAQAGDAGSVFQRITAACVDVWAAFALSITEWAPTALIVYDKFHVMQHLNTSMKPSTEFYLTRWVNLDGDKRQLLNK